MDRREDLRSRIESIESYMQLGQGLEDSVDDIGVNKLIKGTIEGYYLIFGRFKYKIILN